MSKYKETKSNAFYTLLARILGCKYEVESKPYRKIIYQYFNYKEWSYEEHLTYVKTFKKSKKTIIEIETHRPGLLIGKAGTFINGLKQHIIDETKENIEIDLRECQMWHKLYSR